LVGLNTFFSKKLRDLDFSKKPIKRKMATPTSATAVAPPPPPNYQPTVSAASPHIASTRAVHRSLPAQPTVQTPPPSRFKSHIANRTQR
jgi:hypothetical protein